MLFTASPRPSLRDSSNRQPFSVSDAILSLPSGFGSTNGTPLLRVESPSYWINFDSKNRFSESRELQTTPSPLIGHLRDRNLHTIRRPVLGLTRRSEPPKAPAAKRTSFEFIGADEF
ncbi:hypothetical protein NMY22_g10501 [Coprinellus aureogranulatus]|nr:hypothetical protein NMY22_g10501 [Coprinellus aureogranulatus]